MDRNYYYQKRASEHQRGISQELGTRHLHFALIAVLTLLLLHFLV